MSLLCAFLSRTNFRVVNVSAAPKMFMKVTTTFGCKTLLAQAMY